MKIVRVTYIARSEYVEQNQANIRIVMARLHNLGNPGINYNVCLSPDGRTFTHTAFFESEKEEKLLLDLAEFKHFQEQLKSSGLETPPKQELLSLVGSSKNIFSN